MMVEAIGLLRKEFDVPAPGDLRNVMVALTSDVEPLIEESFQYRFKKIVFRGHPLGKSLI